MGLAAMLGQRSMLAGQGAGRIKQTEYLDQLGQENVGNQFKLASALQGQANFNSQQQTRNYWRGEQDAFNRHAFEVGENFKREQAAKSWDYKKDVFEQTGEIHKTRMERADAQTADLKQHRANELQVRLAGYQMHSSGGNPRQAKENIKNIKALFRNKLGEMGDEQVSAVSALFHASADRIFNSEESKMPELDSIYSRAGNSVADLQAQISDPRVQTKMIHQEIDRALMSVKKFRQLKGKLSGWIFNDPSDLREYAKNEASMLEEMETLKWYANQTGDKQVNQWYHEMRAVHSYINEKHAGPLFKLREDTRHTDTKQEMLNDMENGVEADEEPSFAHNILQGLIG